MASMYIWGYNADGYHGNYRKKQRYCMAGVRWLYPHPLSLGVRSAVLRTTWRWLKNSPASQNSQPKNTDVEEIWVIWWWNEIPGHSFWSNIKEEFKCLTIGFIHGCSSSWQRSCLIAKSPSNMMCASTIVMFDIVWTQHII